MKKASLWIFSFIWLPCLTIVMSAKEGSAFSRLTPHLAPEPGEILIRYKPGTALSDIASIYQQFGLFEVGYSPYSGARRVRVPLTLDTALIADILKQNRFIAQSEPNYMKVAHYIPNDPLYIYQWHLNNPAMQQAWDLSIGADVVVAVIDTGIAYRDMDGFAKAPDLANALILPGYDFVNDDPFPDDDNRHGTHMAGTIAQNTNNLLGGAGIAPGCTLMPVKVLDRTGYGDTADIVDGIYYAVNNGAQIINMSLGGARSNKGRRSGRSDIEEEALNYALSQGALVICSAGNEASSAASYPAAYESTVSVTACKFDQSFARAYSNYGPMVSICAPGGDVTEDLNGDGEPDGIYQETHDGKNFLSFDFYYAEGTSSAAAFVSGVAALVLSAATYPLTPEDLRDILQNTATDCGDPGWDQYYGWGVINPLAAVEASIVFSAERRLIRNLNYLKGSSGIYPINISSPLFTAYSFFPLLYQIQPYIHAGFAGRTSQSNTSSSLPNIYNSEIFINIPAFLYLSTLHTCFALQPLMTYHGINVSNYGILNYNSWRN
ncbi:MAG: S8 family serine peptidase [bacterium]